MITYIGADLQAILTVQYRYDIKQVDDYIFNAIFKNINQVYPTDNNLLINAREFGIAYNNTYYQDALDVKDTNFDNMFIVSAIEPWCMNRVETINFLKNMNVPNVTFIGNFDNIDPTLNFHFTWGVYSANTWGNIYNVNELILRDIKYKFINYNRDPKVHRQELVKLIRDNHLDDYGIISLGGELVLEENMDEVTHCFDKVDELCSGDIPNDNSSLGTIEYWNHHFLNVVSESRFYYRDDVFISEKTAKPIIGLRPFIINGNWKIYKWLRENGFRTFEKYFPFAKFEDIHEDEIHHNIIKVLNWVCEQSNDELQILYNKMLPDLIHNRERLFIFAEKEKKRIEKILL